MAHVYPFAAFVPKAGLAKQVATLPYDVMNRREARAMAEGNPLSFLRVTCSDLEFDDALSGYDPQVYARAAANWQRISSEALAQDDKPRYYVYSLVMDGRRQTGIVGCASVEEYECGVVRKHERTRQEKEDDRTRHIQATGAQTGPVFLAYRDDEALNAIMAQTMETEPLFDFTASDGIRHTGWRVADDKAAAVYAAFAAVPRLYIADGHHRAAAACRACQANCGAGESGRTMAVIFPAGQLRILAYNRVVADLNGLSADGFLSRLAALGTLAEEAPAVPAEAGQVCFYMGGKWRSLTFRDRPVNDPIAALDVSLLQDQVLKPMLAIDDPRTSKRIDFVGGIRGTAELERLVDSGAYTVAFSMYPTSLEQLMDVADANGIMPPKSTWFEPKLRDGLFTHVIR